MPSSPRPITSSSWHRPRLDARRAASLIAAMLLTIAAPADAQPTFTPDEAQAVSPSAPVPLFNGRDLSGFYTWLVNDHYADPLRVFSVVQQVDGAPAIRISGERYGGLVTRQRYRRYHLVVEFRWGLLTWAPRLDRTRDSGILVHAEGRDGNTGADFNGPWMRSIEAQVIEGGTGDFILVAGHDADGTRREPSLTATVRSDRTGQILYAPDGITRTFHGGRVNWYGHDPELGTRVGARGVQDVESPAGEWTRLEVIVEDDRITNVVNGRVVNVGTAPSLREGRIIIQSEGAEIYIRRVELYPLAPPTPR